MLTPKVSDKKYYQQSLKLCKYRWVLKFKIDISTPFPLTTISYSFLGDIFITLYAQYFCLWSKVPGKPFENVMCCYNGHECPISNSKASLRMPSPELDSKGEFPANLNSEISTDGRLILISTHNSRTAQIWFNQMYLNGNESSESTEFTLASTQLEHDNPVVFAKFKQQNYFETVAKFIPNIAVTITKDCKIHLWVESFSQNSIEFYEFETINEFIGEQIYPNCAFIRKNDKNEVFSYQRDDVIISKIMNPHSDHIYYLMKDNNDLGITKQNYAPSSSDWICFITVFLINNILI